MKHIIIGNSAAGLSAAEQIRKNDKGCDIIVITEESFRNYSKPLITYYLADKLELEKVYFKDDDFYKKNDLDLKTNTKVVEIDTEGKRVVFDSGKGETFDKLLIANGGIPIIPGIKVIDRSDGKSLMLEEAMQKINGLFTLTTLEDAINIKNYILNKKIKSASILGGGLIGMKTTEAFLELGLKIDLIELADRVLAATFDLKASSILENRIIEQMGSIYKRNTIEEIYIEKNNLSAFKLKDGRTIDSKLVIIAVGVDPDLSLVKKESILTGRGVIVDEYMSTTCKDIYAAGDVAESYDILSNTRRNIAIWPLAVRQGFIAGNNMSGGKRSYKGGFFKNSVEILGVPSISMGITNIEKGMGKGFEVFEEFEPLKNFYRKIIVKEGKVIGAILIGNIERAGIYAGLINNKIDISNVVQNIAKEDFGIIQLPSDYRKHLVVGEGIEV